MPKVAKDRGFAKLISISKLKGRLEVFSDPGVGFVHLRTILILIDSNHCSS